MQGGSLECLKSHFGRCKVAVCQVKRASLGNARRLSAKLAHVCEYWLRFPFFFGRVFVVKRVAHCSAKGKEKAGSVIVWSQPRVFVCCVYGSCDVRKSVSGVRKRELGCQGAGMQGAAITALTACKGSCPACRPTPCPMSLSASMSRWWQWRHIAGTASTESASLSLCRQPLHPCC